MTNKPQKLELTWIGKDERPRLEPRILIEDPERSYSKPLHAPWLTKADQPPPNPSLTKEGSYITQSSPP
jgi:hypothetical protein